MDDKKLSEIERQIIEGMDSEANAEKEIDETSSEIAAQLMASNKVNSIINGINYVFAYRVLSNGNKKNIFMLVSNVVRYKIAGDKYKPFTINAEMDTRYDLRANLKAAIEAFIRHITGRMKPGILEDED